MWGEIRYAEFRYAVTPITDVPRRGLNFRLVTVESYIADTANFSAPNASQCQIPSWAVDNKVSSTHTLYCKPLTIKFVNCKRS